MSTSDPHRPGGATDGRPDATTPDDGRHVHRGDDAGRRRLPAHEVAPTVETLDPPTPTEPEPRARRAGHRARARSPSPRTPDAEPVAEPEPLRAAATRRPERRSRRHRPPRGRPPRAHPARRARAGPGRQPPARPPVTAARRPPTPRARRAADPDAAARRARGRTGRDAAAPPPPPSDDRLFPDPNAPRSTTVGSHILGVLVGLILTPIGVARAAAGRVPDPAGAGRRLGRVDRGARHRARLARPAAARLRAAARRCGPRRCPSRAAPC